MIIGNLPDKYFNSYLMNKTLMQLFLHNRTAPFNCVFDRTLQVMDQDYLKNVLVYALKFEEKDVKRMLRAGNAKYIWKKTLSFFMK